MQRIVLPKEHFLIVEAGSSQYVHEHKGEIFNKMPKLAPWLVYDPETDQISFEADDTLMIAVDHFAKWNAHALAPLYGYDFSELMSKMLGKDIGWKPTLTETKHMERVARTLYEAVPKDSIPVKWSSLGDEEREDILEDLCMSRVDAKFKETRRKMQKLTANGGSWNQYSILEDATLFRCSTDDKVLGLCTQETKRTFVGGPLAIEFAIDRKCGNPPFVVTLIDGKNDPAQVLFDDLPDAWRVVVSDMAKWYAPWTTDRSRFALDLIVHADGDDDDEDTEKKSLEPYRRAYVALQDGLMSRVDRQNVLRKLNLEVAKESGRMSVHVSEKLEHVRRLLKQLNVSNEELELMSYWM